jgi:hypothetical protein
MVESSSEEVERIEYSLPLAPECIPVRAVEIVVYLNEEGVEEIGCRWQGSKNPVLELGMVEYAKMMILAERQRQQEEDEDDHPD